MRLPHEILRAIMAMLPLDAAERLGAVDRLCLGCFKERLKRLPRVERWRHIAVVADTLGEVVRRPVWCTATSLWRDWG